MGKKKRKEIELMEHRAMIELPENAMEVVLKCKVFDHGEMISVSRTMDLNDIRTAFDKADKGYIDDDDRFVITDKDREYLDNIMYTMKENEL